MKMQVLSRRKNNTGIFIENTHIEDDKIDITLTNDCKFTGIPCTEKNMKSINETINYCDEFYFTESYYDDDGIDIGLKTGVKIKNIPATKGNFETLKSQYEKQYAVGKTNLDYFKKKASQSSAIAALGPIAGIISYAGFGAFLNEPTIGCATCCAGVVVGIVSYMNARDYEKKCDDIEMHDFPKTYVKK